MTPSLVNQRHLVDEALAELSDVEYQRRVWLGRDPGEVSSFVEAVCRLYDDYGLRRLVASLDNRDGSWSELIETFRLLDEAIDRVDDQVLDEVLIELPECALIRQLAARARVQLKEHTGQQGSRTGRDE
jgi:hypothetical protein